MIKRTLFGCALWLVLAAVFPVNAQTMSYADAIAQLAAACKNDIARYCGECHSVLALKPASTPTRRECPRNASRRAGWSTLRFREGPQRSAILAMLAAPISPDCAAPRMPMRISSNACSAYRRRR